MTHLKSPESIENPTGISEGPRPPGRSSKPQQLLGGDVENRNAWFFRGAKCWDFSGKWSECLDVGRFFVGKS